MPWKCGIASDTLFARFLGGKANVGSLQNWLRLSHESLSRTTTVIPGGFLYKSATKQQPHNCRVQLGSLLQHSIEGNVPRSHEIDQRVRGAHRHTTRSASLGTSCNGSCSNCWSPSSRLPQHRPLALQLLAVRAQLGNPLPFVSQERFLSTE